MSDEHEKVLHAVVMFEQSVTTLVGPRFDRVEGRYVTRASRYTEIREQARITADSPTHRSGSTSPAWIDGLDWLRSVDRTVRGWMAGENTPHRLHALTDANWRPQDVGLITSYTQACLDWAHGADELLDPKRKWTVAAACPNCEVTHVYRQHAGEHVKVPALLVTTDSCKCLNCKETWPPEHFELLAKAIGCAPAG